MIFVCRDPLSQIFSFTQNRVISAVGLQFTQRDPGIPVTVQIRGVTTGLHNDTVLTEKVIAPSEINLGADVLVRVRFSSGRSNDTPALNFKDVNLDGI